MTLIQLRNNKLLSQKEVSEKTGISMQTLSGLENYIEGKARHKYVAWNDTLRKLLDFYGVTDYSSVEEFVAIMEDKAKRQEQRRLQRENKDELEKGSGNITDNRDSTSK